ncbi:MAG: hypothetical protein ACJAYU_000409 [Bradymonadia bacterium]|jgi:hypothetical protein
MIGSPDAVVGEVAAGTVDVARWVAVGWNAVQRIEPSEPADGMRFGADVSVHGVRAAVGAPGAAGIGKVYVFAEDRDSWQLRATIDPEGDPEVARGFGTRVALYETALLISSRAVDSGQVDVYEEWTRWLRYGSLSDPNLAAGERFGAAIALHEGRLAIVGDPADRDGVGAAYVYERSDGHWGGAIPLIMDERASAGGFGCGVELTDESAFVGHCGADGGVGAVEVFERVGPRLEHVGTLAADTEAELRLGSARLFSLGTTR